MPVAVSVILTSFNRRDFVGSAMASIMGQSADPSRFEVIVSTNYEDPLVTRVCDHSGWTRILTRQPRAGGQTAEAFARCDGELIAFLDDDDVWVPEKLRHTEMEFGNDPNLEFYNHSHLPIDDKGDPILWSGRRDRDYLERQRDGSRLTFGSDTMTRPLVDRIARGSPRNNSSIVVSRKLMERFVEYLPRVESSIDHFFLFGALISSPKALIEHVPLTMWRVHPTSWSNISLVNFERFRSKVEETSRRISHDTALFAMMARRQGAPEVARYLEHKVSTLDLLSQLLTGARSRSLSFAAVLEGLRGLRSNEFQDYWQKMELGCQALTALSPDLARAGTYLYLQQQSPRRVLSS